ncbi:MAG TPA: hypothetical protein VLI90_00410 [Tepidisphaeraceae bacterium]|nr:hypothetical protein [Tepidisphaeraceae bacterium]
MLEQRQLLTTVLLTGTPGGDFFQISSDDNDLTYRVTQPNQPDQVYPASYPLNVSITGGGGGDQLYVASGVDVAVLNDPGADGTSLSIDEMDSGTSLTFAAQDTRLNDLSLDPGAAAVVARDGTHLLEVNSFAVGPDDAPANSQLDLSDNGFIIHAGSSDGAAYWRTALQYEVSQGHLNGWAGDGIGSDLLPPDELPHSVLAMAIGNGGNVAANGGAAINSFFGRPAGPDDLLANVHLSRRCEPRRAGDRRRLPDRPGQRRHRQPDLGRRRRELRRRRGFDGLGFDCGRAKHYAAGA